MSDLVQFTELGIHDELLPALRAKNFVEPSAIQKLAIPLLISGEKDLIGQALTGTGKTAAFGLPIIQEIAPGDAPRALILAPTRELSIQIAGELDSLKGAKNLRITPLYGGQAIQLQLAALKKGVDIAVGTPGRIMDLYRRKALKLDQLQFAVLDEADEMLDMGFVEDIREILQLTNSEKRMLMFSATMPDEIMAIAGEFMRPDYLIARTGDTATNPKLTEQYFYEVRRQDKISALKQLIEATPDIYALIFCRTRADVDEVTAELNAGKYSVEALHGEISQAQRLRVIEGFKRRKFPLLIATDVAARGIDVNDLSHVINFSLPQNPETYIHRIGRTGRAGRHGVAITFATPGELRKLKRIEEAIDCPIPKRKLPDAADILEARKNALCEKVALTLAEEEKFSAYLNFAEELCVLGDHPAQVMAALLYTQFGDTLLHVPEAEKPEMTKLLLFAGRATGLTMPDLLREIYDRTGIRGNELGKIICRADKTFINAHPKDAEKILQAFQHDPDLRFKIDDGRKGKGEKNPPAGKKENKGKTRHRTTPPGKTVLRRMVQLPLPLKPKPKPEAKPKRKNGRKNLPPSGRSSGAG